ncbi:MAG: hypothetical protein H7Y01_14355 [Ferruginibacter sp.]|nr:hypothetical protein [Chitinophagaceae bacterium]
MIQTTVNRKCATTVLIFLISTITCWGQLDKNISLAASGNFNFGLNEFQTLDDAGFGISFEALFAAKKRVGITAETGGDWFGGDKELDFENGKNKKPAIYHVRGGPHFFVTKRIRLAATYGFAHYIIREIDFSSAGSYKLSVTALLGAKKKLLARFYHAGVTRDPKTLSYFGVSLGYKIL